MPAKEITIDDELKELKRELRMRERLYPGWTKGPSPKIKPDDAKHQLACLESTIARLEKDIASKRGEQAKLF
ncbi:hypothetical protein GCM10027347_52800 [Larkinella harenae]